MIKCLRNLKSKSIRRKRSQANHTLKSIVKLMNERKISEEEYKIFKQFTRELQRKKWFITTKAHKIKYNLEICDAIFPQLLEEVITKNHTIEQISKELELRRNTVERSLIDMTRILKHLSN